MPEAQIDDVFNNAIIDLTTQANEQGAVALDAEGLRPWNRPATSSDWNGDPLQIEDTIKPFDRTKIGEVYEEMLADGTDSGTVGDGQALKTQSDYLAVMQRGFRARHCTPVRLMAMAIARREGHGDPQGILSGGAMGYVTSLIRNGKST